MTDWIRYFAYGSNMHPARLRERTPSCQRIGVARLPGHRLYFHQRSATDGTGKCNIVATQRADDVVHGVVYDLPRAERPALDAAEDLGHGYRIEHLEVLLNGVSQTVFCYTAIPSTIDDSLRPFCWYRDIVLHGARQHAFPEPYLHAIAQTGIVEDQDAERLARYRELLAIHEPLK